MPIGVFLWLQGQLDRRLPGWSQTGRTRELHYLDPSAGPSTGTWALLGWLAAGDYRTPLGPLASSTSSTSAAPAGEHRWLRNGA